MGLLRRSAGLWIDDRGGMTLLQLDFDVTRWLGLNETVVLRFGLKGFSVGLVAGIER